MTTIRRLDFHRGQLQQILQKTLLYLRRNLIEFIQINEQKLYHALQHLALLRKKHVVGETPRQFVRYQTATEGALVVALLGNEQRHRAVAVLAAIGTSPLIYHAQKPGVEPVFPMRI